MTLKDWIEAGIIASLGSGMLFAAMHFSGFMPLDGYFHWFVTAPVALGSVVWFVMWYRTLPAE